MLVYIIDRFEGEYAVLEEESGAHKDVHRAILPKNAAEGDFLHFDGINYSIDKAATETRKRMMEEKMRKIMKK